ncbi:hypothetical protein [Senegalia massiliensis]|uniref:Uncharacterized protein n=1 Tax=Senegalia massiliensis TaxID=1720316 RepID=A0A845R075_9CLOT|nr:hypothetical protein [Senegalia massiliensis]NBI07614.1 hypothetical protein [Senegalia massiliensis]
MSVLGKSVKDKTKVVKLSSNNILNFILIIAILLMFLSKLGVIGKVSEGLIYIYIGIMILIILTSIYAIRYMIATEIDKMLKLKNSIEHNLFILGITFAFLFGYHI